MTAERKKILCIEDDRIKAALIAGGLSDRGFDVDVAHDGEHGFVAILKDKPDLVLCDVNLPSAPGRELLERLTELAPRLGDVPFVFLTDPTERHNKSKRRHVGAIDHVTTPLDLDALAKVIKSRLADIARTKLNDREIKTLTWVARGKTSAEIAEQLGMVKRTVDFHIDNARMKLGATTRTAAVSKAVAAGLIQP
jgi:DNA-binding NarL/FixJ family response regulator